MKRKIFILIGLIFYSGCSSNNYQSVSLILFPVVEKAKIDPEDKEGFIGQQNNTSNSSSSDRWKDIIVLYNTDKDIQLEHQNGSITIYKNSAVLVDDMLGKLKFNTKIDLFNFLKKNYSIYDRKNIAYKHICEIRERKKGKE